MAHTLRYSKPSGSPSLPLSAWQAMVLDASSAAALWVPGTLLKGGGSPRRNFQGGFEYDRLILHASISGAYPCAAVAAPAQASQECASGDCASGVGCAFSAGSVVAVWCVVRVASGMPCPQRRRAPCSVLSPFRIGMMLFLAMSRTGLGPCTMSCLPWATPSTLTAAACFRLTSQPSWSSMTPVRGSAGRVVMSALAHVPLRALLSASTTVGLPCLTMLLLIPSSACLLALRRFIGWFAFGWGATGCLSGSTLFLGLSGSALFVISMPWATSITFCLSAQPPRLLARLTRICSRLGAQPPRCGQPFTAPHRTGSGHQLHLPHPSDSRG